MKERRLEDGIGLDGAAPSDDLGRVFAPVVGEPEVENLSRGRVVLVELTEIAKLAEAVYEVRLERHGDELVVADRVLDDL